MLRDIVRAIEKDVSAVGQEIVPCIKALDRVAARTVKAGRNLPPFAISALDGFACRGGGKEFIVKAWLGPGEQCALHLKAGEAVFVPTGAAIPTNTRFVPVEHVREDRATILVETLTDMRKIWKKGYWIRKGDGVATRGTRIRPRAMELLALAGLEKIAVFRKPRVSILSTGNELKKGIVVNSNQYLLTGLIERNGGEVAHMAVAGDDEGEIGGALSGMTGADLLLVTGGTAKGKKDVTHSSFQVRGATFLLEALPVVPGKTMTFGKLGRTPFFILPGNPRALRTLYDVFIKPCLLKVAGRTGSMRFGKASAPEDIEKETDKIHLIPVAFSAAGAPYIRELYVDEPDGFIILERGTERVRTGEEVEIQWADS
jgi:molybdopterin molybdotransferase